ncbi:MAG: MOSC domain-containing protein [Candidatus Hodarchaeales archaeon]|jgi:MOSC domain-containing protein YiiM
MKILSINVGKPRKLIWQGREVETSIFKEPVTGSVKIKILNIEGDKQADLTVHGGINKAVYAYSAEYYLLWEKELPEISFPWGVFGENLTVQGLNEDNVNIGDIFQLGTAKLMAVQPRLPCYKLSVRFQRLDMIKRFLESKRTGIYFSVIKEGEVIQGDDLKLLREDQNAVKISEITRLFAFDRDDLESLNKVVKVKALPESWKLHFRELIEKQIIN